MDRPAPPRRAEKFPVPSSPFGQGPGGDAQLLSHLGARTALAVEFSEEFGGLLPHLVLAQFADPSAAQETSHAAMRGRWRPG